MHILHRIADDGSVTEQESMHFISESLSMFSVWVLFVGFPFVFLRFGCLSSVCLSSFDCVTCCSSVMLSSLFVIVAYVASRNDSVTVDSSVLLNDIELSRAFKTVSERSVSIDSFSVMVSLGSL